MTKGETGVLVSETVYSGKKAGLLWRKAGVLSVDKSGRVVLTNRRTALVLVDRGKGLVPEIALDAASGITLRGSPDSAKTYRWSGENSLPAWEKALRQAGLLGISYFYRLEKSIGKGCHGEVYRAACASTGQLVAVKALNKSSDGAISERIRRELAIYRTARHPYIARYVDDFEDASTVYIVMEYISGGELTEELVNGPLSVTDVAKVVKNVATAVRYLHEQGICYRDIKLDNILCRTRCDVSTAVIADFSASKTDLTGPSAVMTTPVGTGFYLAPEQVRGEYSSKVDSWALGVLCYLLYTAKFPFDSDDEVTYYKRLLSGDVQFAEPCWGACQELRSFVQQLLTVDQDKRLDIVDAFDHPFVVKYAT